MEMARLPGPFWLVGCGNMAGAMLSRWLENGIDRSLLTVIRPSGKPVAEGVRVLKALPVGEAPSLVMLGIKPQKLDEVVPALAPVVGPGTIIISILAGIELASLRERFPDSGAIFKAMPNTPVRLGKGITNLFTDTRDAAAVALVEKLLAQLGRVEWFEEERLFQAAGILSGAGPAFLFRFIDALANGGEKIGLPPHQAARLALGMVEGASALARSAGESPAALAEKVASPGGTTRAGLNVLDEAGALNTLLESTLAAGLRRSLEMAEEARAAS